MYIIGSGPPRQLMFIENDCFGSCVVIALSLAFLMSYIILVHVLQLLQDLQLMLQLPHLSFILAFGI